jgi:hypothetical protein
MRIFTVLVSAALLLSSANCTDGIAKTKPTKVAASTSTSPSAVLKNVSLLAHRLKRASLDVINDLEQRDMVVTGEQELIQPIPMKDDDKAIGWAQQMEDLGPALPPKKSWLDTDVGNVGELIDLLAADMNMVQIPAGQESSWTALKAVVQDMQTHYKDLKAASQGPKYDNLAIGKQALKIYDDVKKLEDPWKAAVKATPQ